MAIKIIKVHDDEEGELEGGGGRDGGGGLWCLVKSW